MNRVLRWLLYGLMWAFAGVAIFVAAQRARIRQASQIVHALKIDFPDSTSHGQLVTREMVLRWLDEEQIRWAESAVSELNLHDIEQRLCRNGFVGEVKASVDYRGVLCLKIRQREPLFRLLVDGYNHYVTADGYLFRAPAHSSIYVPVLTGAYQPPFPRDYEGWLQECRTESLEKIEATISDLEREKYPYYEREKENLDYHRETRRMFIRKGLLESREHFDERVERLRAEKRQRRRHYRYINRQIEEGIAAVERQQEVLRQSEKKFLKNYEDFQKLTTFVKQIEADAFWRSEIVQIVISEAHSGALEVEVVPRSGGWTAELGGLDGLDEKLEKLERFCHKGLSRLGWDRVQTIRVQYEDKVVCVERPAERH